MFRPLATAAILIMFSGGAVLAADGAALFKQNCSSCHGADGKADTAVAKAMKVPALAGDEKVQKMSAADVATKVKENPKHPKTVKALSDDDVNALAAFVKQLAGGK